MFNVMSRICYDILFTALVKILIFIRLQVIQEFLHTRNYSTEQRPLSHDAKRGVFSLTCLYGGIVGLQRMDFEMDLS